MNHNQVVANFGARKANPRNNNQVTWKGSRIYSDDQCLYSYGRHFILAVYLGSDREGPVFLKNGDKYSSSTTEHQSLVQKHLRGPTVSFSALNSAGWQPSSMTAKDILDWQPDDWTDVVRNKDTGHLFRAGETENTVGEPFTVTAGMYVPSHSGDEFTTAEGTFTRGHWHRLAAVLLRANDGDIYLSGLDEGSYFLSQFPKNSGVSWIRGAFDFLKPRPVREAEEFGTTVERQGEWFFVKTEHTKARELGFKEKDAKQRAIPDSRPNQRNSHVAVLLVRGEEVYAKGNVYHRNNAGRATREHRTLGLGDHWHRVYRNTEAASWTSQGNVD
jgi:hypothetical protein